MTQIHPTGVSHLMNVDVQYSFVICVGFLSRLEAGLFRLCITGNISQWHLIELYLCKLLTD